MPNDDPRDGFFYPTHTLMIDSYNPGMLYGMLRSVYGITWHGVYVGQYELILLAGVHVRIKKVLLEGFQLNV